MSFSVSESVEAGPFWFGLVGSGDHTTVDIRGPTGPRPRAFRLSISENGLRCRAAAEVEPIPPLPLDGGMQEITSGPVSALSDVSSEELLEHLNAGLAAFNPVTPFLFCIGLTAILGSPIIGSILYTALLEAGDIALLGALVGGGLSAVGGIMLLYAGTAWMRRFRLQNTIVLLFDIDRDTLVRRAELYRALADVAECDRCWHVATHGRTSDWKRNGGAGVLLTRTRRKVMDGNPVGIRTNVDIQHLSAGREHLYFLPDRLLVHDRSRNRYGMVQYAEIRVDFAVTRFIEGEPVSADAEIVDHTWEKVNRDGGPDRRFARNRQLPVCLYGEITLTSASGLHEQFQVSRTTAARRLGAALTTFGTEPEPTIDRTSAEPEPTHPQSKARAFALATVLKYAAVADRRFDDQERRTIQRALHSEFGDEPLVRDHAGHLIEALKTDREAVETCLTVLAAGDADERRRWFAHVATLSTADGKVTPKEKQRIQEIEMRLGLA